MPWVLILLFFVFTFLIIGGGIFLIVWLIRKAMKKPDQETLGNDLRELLGRVERERTKLTPWGSQTYQDITLGMQYRWQKGLANRLGGKLLNRQGDEIIAFQRVQRGFHGDGFIVAASTGFMLVCSRQQSVMTVRMNKEALGKIDAQGRIFDAQGAHIGQLPRSTQISIQIGGLNFEPAPGELVLHLNGRALATVSRAPNYMRKTSFTAGASSFRTRQVIVPKAEPTPEEEKWLVALAIIEPTFHGVDFLD